MFLKKIKPKIVLLLITYLILPLNILAYSDYIYASGENVGIRINSAGVIIIGTYKVNGENNALLAGLKNGDVITKINNEKIENIENMIDVINNTRNLSVKVDYLRNNKEYQTVLNVSKDNNTLKTGLYVKDSITGIGTLTYIDPSTNIFGALGHEVAEANTGVVLSVKTGSIFDSVVTGIEKSSIGNPGSKNATLNFDTNLGTVLENTSKGIFGTYIEKYDNKNLYKVAHEEDVKLGSAKILTVLSNDEVKEYSINILKINKKGQETKNILFEITDKELLNITGGVVQGMSGSPIIQNEYIVGAVTHVVVDNPINGYGILITNMLEEAEN